MKKRIDILIRERNLARSRSVAQRLIKQGLVKVNGKTVNKPSEKVSPKAEIEIESKPKYVGRGGIKLEHALKDFDIDVKGLKVLDVGSSTGGFTDCLIQHGASHVYAVDVGKDQIDNSLKNLPNVSVFEQTDIRDLKELPNLVDLAVIDVSFISLTLVLNSIKKFLKPKGKIVALIKPQFEVGKKKVGKKGVVKSEETRKEAIDKIKKWSKSNGFNIIDLTKSRLEGDEGNVEYFIYLELNK